MRRLPPLLTFASLLAAAAGCRDDTTSPLPSEQRYDLLVEARQAGGPPELLLLREGRPPARLFPPGMQASDPAPSADGLKIVFVVADYSQGIGDIWVADRDGSNARQLTFAPELDDQPSWSPGGHSIVFRSFRTGREGDIWVMNSTGGDLYNLTPDPLPGVTDESRPVWSPSGDYIAYVSTAGGDHGIWVMHPDGSDKRQLTDTPDLDTEPAWSPGTVEIAFRRSSPTLGSDIWVVPFGGGEARRIARSGEQRLPAWSRDGKSIAFVEGSPGGPSQIWTMDPDGTSAVLRTTDPAWVDAINPVWLARPPAPSQNAGRR